jgi:xylan 1,4-beta-xylosidase
MPTKTLVAALLLALLPTPGAASAQPARVIAADAAHVSGRLDTFFRTTVGAGRAAEGLRADWQRDLDVVHRECGFTYIRFHGLLQDELGVYAEDKQGRPVYNFQYVDAIYDRILALGMRPFVELGFMPRALASGDQTIFWWNGNVTPPHDMAKWEALVRELVRHWTDRYGADEVKTWYFEVWNEPNLKPGFWTGDQKDYLDLYAASARAIKSVSPEYRVGGPATAGNAWVPETIAFAVASGAPIDFVTTHDYGVDGAGLDADGGSLTKLNPSPDAIVKNVRAVRAQIEGSAKPGLPLHYTEWSTSYTPRDPVHDHYISAPYILSRLRAISGSAQSMSYWTFTDIFEEPGPVPTPFHGGFGLLNFQGLRKPAFYAYQFLNRLGEEQLASTDAGSWVCRDAKGGMQVLFWDYTPPKTDEPNQTYFVRDLVPKDLGTARVELSSLPAGDYELRVYRVGYHVNDVYGEYLALGRPRSLTREQVRTLAEKTDGRPIATDRVRIGADGRFAREVPMRENDVYLITLDKTGRG